MLWAHIILIFYNPQQKDYQQQYVQVALTGRNLKGGASKYSAVGRERCAYFFWQGEHSKISLQVQIAFFSIFVVGSISRYLFCSHGGRKDDLMSKRCIFCLVIITLTELKDDEWMNELMNEYEWINEEWMNEWLNEYEWIWMNEEWMND